jgi:hypothetical protein
VRGTFVLCLGCLPHLASTRAREPVGFNDSSLCPLVPRTCSASWRLRRRTTSRRLSSCRHPRTVPSSRRRPPLGTACSKPSTSCTPSCLRHSSMCPPPPLSRLWLRQRFGMLHLPTLLPLRTALQGSAGLDGVTGGSYEGAGMGLASVSAPAYSCSAHMLRPFTLTGSTTL